MKHIHTFESFLNEKDDSAHWAKENSRICKLIFDEFIKAKVPSIMATSSSIPLFEKAYRPLLNKVEDIQNSYEFPEGSPYKTYGERSAAAGSWGEKYAIKFAPLGRYISIYRDNKKQGYDKNKGWGLKAAGRDGQMGGDMCTPAFLFMAVCSLYGYKPEKDLNMTEAQIYDALDA